MLTPDVNVLVYAHRRDERTNAAYRTWLEELVNGDAPFGLSVLVALGFVRVVTNARVYKSPTAPEVALATIDALIAAPGCRLLAPGPRHWTLARALCEKTTARGKLVADAQHAAVAIEHGCEWVTRDGDFARFAPHGLRWLHLSL